MQHRKKKNRDKYAKEIWNKIIDNYRESIRENLSGVQIEEKDKKSYLRRLGHVEDWNKNCTNNLSVTRNTRRNVPSAARVDTNSLLFLFFFFF